MARAVGLCYTSVQRIWKAHDLKPHLVKTFKLSNDKRFVEKVHDIVGLYLNPPNKALVFSVDEKSQIQALDRTQPGLPMKKGRAGTMTHDYTIRCCARPSASPTTSRAARSSPSARAIAMASSSRPRPRFPIWLARSFLHATMPQAVQ
jgi:hypothetical protein